MHWPGCPKQLADLAAFSLLFVIYFFFDAGGLKMAHPTGACSESDLSWTLQGRATILLQTATPPAQTMLFSKGWL